VSKAAEELREISGWLVARAELAGEPVSAWHPEINLLHAVADVMDGLEPHDMEVCQCHCDRCHRTAEVLKAAVDKAEKIAND